MQGGAVFLTTEWWRCEVTEALFAVMMANAALHAAPCALFDADDHVVGVLLHKSGETNILEIVRAFGL